MQNEFELNLCRVLAHTIVLDHGPDAGLQGKGPSPPTPVDPAKVNQENLLSQMQAMRGIGPFQETGSIPDLQKEFQPQEDALQLKQINDMLYGTGGQKGTLQQYEDMQPGINALTSQERAADIQDVMKLGPTAMKAARAANPEGAGLVDTMARSASDRLALNGALDPFTKKMLQQDIRSGQAARGMGTGVNDAAAEAYYEDATRDARRRADLGDARSATAMTQSFYGDPFQQILARSGGMAPGMAAVGQASAQGQTGVGNTNAIFNPNMGGALSLAQQQYGTEFAANQASSENSNALIGGGIGAGGLLAGVGLLAF
jgi:hypothetical protein